MKALSLWQPYASLIALGAKTIETRSWATSYRGPLVILAAKKWNADIAGDCHRCGNVLRANCFEIPSDRNRRIGLLPWESTLGHIVACCELADCRPMQWAPRHKPLDAEFGTFGPGRFGWDLRNVVPVLPPIPYQGRQGLFDVPASILKGHLP